MRIRIIIDIVLLVKRDLWGQGLIAGAMRGCGIGRARGLVAGLASTAILAGCGAHANASATRTTPGVINAVGAESQYANVISQIGGRYVSVTAIMDNPNTDPHSFEASPSVAQTVSGAKLVVQNGLGYDGFMNKIESASANSARRVIDVQTLLGLPDSTRNPHLWYDPRTMPKLASQLVKDFAAIEPAHAAYFKAQARRFDASLRPWLNAIGNFKQRHPGTPVATTEPVANYMLRAAGAHDVTPWNLQADIMNGVDPAPEDIDLQRNLLEHHRVKALLYNQQVTDTLTQSFLSDAAKYHVPVVGVYETMPSGYSYQSWMLGELAAVTRAVNTGQSTTRLG